MESNSIKLIVIKKVISGVALHNQYIYFSIQLLKDVQAYALKVPHLEAWLSSGKGDEYVRGLRLESIKQSITTMSCNVNVKN